jgi:N-methylhydantoinase A
MERALRVVSVERGHDPREFTLVAFGGAGPLHACDLAEALRIPRVLIPPHPGVLSALGMATAPIVKDLSASVMFRLEPTVGADNRRHPRLTRIRSELDQRGRAELESEGFPLTSLRTETILDMRYAGQSYELPITTRSLDPDRFLAAFHRAHRARFGHSDPTRPVEVVNLRLKLILPAPSAPRAARPEELVGGAADGRQGASTRPKPLAHCDVWFARTGARPGVDNPVRTPFHDRASLTSGATIRGPAVITQMDSTTVLSPGWQATVDTFKNLVLERG